MMSPVPWSVHEEEAKARKVLLGCGAPSRTLVIPLLSGEEAAGWGVAPRGGDIGRRG
jgi:hypothetical protein